MKHSSKIFILPFIMLLSGSCQKEEITLSDNAKDHFFLKSDGAEMPVWVEGNTESKTLVIFLHGGPGGSSIGYNELGIFDYLEQYYGVVYWDQRCAGASQGNCNPDNLTVESYVNDLDKLIILLQLRYGCDVGIFLLGDSWGGTLATAYITTENFQKKIKGVIVTVGVHNFPLFMQEKQSMLNHFADQQIALGNRTNDWNNIKSSISGIDLSTIEALNVLQEKAYLAQTYLEEIDSIQSINLSGGKPNSLGFSYILNNNITSEAMWPQLLDYNLSSKLPNIVIPVALLFGQYDFVVPPNLAQDFYDKLNTPNKELYIIENADHNLGVANGIQTYKDKTSNFIATYK